MTVLEALLVALLLLCGTGTVQAAPKTAAPNILLIVADDLGYSDLGAFGSEIPTPNLDRLAAGGVRLTGFYTSPFCAPTRAMLLSGVDNHRAGFGDQVELMLPEQKGKPGYEGFLNERVAPLPRVLRDAGYRTLMAGKWHLGNRESEGPHQRGFDRSYALASGGSSHWGDQLGIVATERGKAPMAMFREDGRPIRIPQDFYSSEVFARKIIEYIDEGRGSGKPFFAYLAFTAPHWPLHARDEDIRRFEGVYDGGYDALRARRLAGLEAQGIIAGDATVYTGHAAWPKWDTLDDDLKRAESKRMAVYAAMVHAMDREIGRVLDYLKAQGELDNTFVFFMSDNGADGNSILDVAHDREWIHSSMNNGIANTGRIGSFVEYGPGWAQVSETPLRMYKSFTYEGGISAPAIAWGPGLGVGGGIRHSLVHVMDVAPTLYEIGRARYPGAVRGRTALLPLQGKSMLAYLQGRQERVHGPEEAVGWELGGRKALRKGDWKIVSSNQPWGTGTWELYDMARDRAETQDLAAAMPGKVAELVESWQQYVTTNGVLDIPGLSDRPGYSNSTGYYDDLRFDVRHAEDDRTESRWR